MNMKISVDEGYIKWNQKWKFKEKLLFLKKVSDMCFWVSISDCMKLQFIKHAIKYFVKASFNCLILFPIVDVFVIYFWAQSSSLPSDLVNNMLKMMYWTYPTTTILQNFICKRKKFYFYLLQIKKSSMQPTKEVYIHHE